ncbi:MAG: ABC transporter permease [Planctomycetota bacterium]|nr:ABC transporter permease [Planctomycetota bacterium]
MSDHAAQRNFVEATGARVIGGVRYLGGMAILLGQAISATKATLARGSGRQALAGQMVRVGVRSVGIVCLVQIFIGVILALQLAPPLEPWGQVDKIANIIGVAGFRMLGPILTAVVISGFAGASIAAELGTMVVAEEIEALQAHALNPVRFLVVPRLLATFIMMILLTIIANWMIAVGGYATALLVLEPKVTEGYWTLMRDQLRLRDFASGLIMAGVFGVLISLIACYEGLRVRGGAEGVGKATTMTVVYSIVSIILAAGVFTTIFYVFGF